MSSGYHKIGVATSMLVSRLYILLITIMHSLCVIEALLNYPQAVGFKSIATLISREPGHGSVHNYGELTGHWGALIGWPVVPNCST